jgi:hypothetical protein
MAAASRSLSAATMAGTRFAWAISPYQYDADANGRFFVYRAGDETGSFANTLTVLQNWTKGDRRPLKPPGILTQPSWP